MDTETDLAPPHLRLYTLKEAADILRCSPRYLYELVRLRKVPSTKIGGKVRFTQKHLEAAIARNERPAVTR